MVNGVAQAIYLWGREARKLQTGRFQHYALAFTAAALVILIVRLVRGF
jgi:hypothetical protein